MEPENMNVQFQLRTVLTAAVLAGFAGNGFGQSYGIPVVIGTGSTARVEAEDYDTGGAGVSYWDSDGGNNGGAYRSDDVDIEGCTDIGGGYNVGWIAPDEWLKYPIDVQENGIYTIDIRVASLSAGGSFYLDVGGTNLSGTVSVPVTGGWQSWTTVTVTNVPLYAGANVFEFYSLESGYNVNWFDFTYTGGGGVTAVDDSMTMRLFSKAGIPVLSNDTGSPNASTVEILSGPSFGTALAQANGIILYEHTSASPSSDAFTYRVQDLFGSWSEPATVTVTFSADLRLENTTVSMPMEPPPTSYNVVDAFPGISFSFPLSMDSPPGDNDRLFVAQRNGEIHVITNISDTAPGSTLFMDISSLVNDDGNEEGLKSIAFHPGYATNRYFYLSYCHTSGGGSKYIRVSRFETQSGNPNAGDSGSELILINEINNGPYHNIDNIAFGPDGYLYVGIGDEGPQYDGSQNTQRIDKDMWSALLRIDVDKKPGNLEPNAFPSIPTDGSGLANFSIPADNPFIGATSFNGAAVNPGDVHTEFFAVGLRNPWQFSFDPLNGDIWLGDVGNSTWEEINIITNGGNYGWAYYEGTYDAGVGHLPLPPPAAFVHSLPVWEYPHGNGEFAGYSVTGGIVYRGSVYPDLYGKYLCSDYVSGNIWTITRTATETNVVRIAGEGAIVQFGLDPATGEILMVDIGDGVIRRLVSETDTEGFPQALSETGFFADLTDLSPNPGVVAYEPNLAFWSDYAIKSRWFVITNLTDTVGYNRDDPWTFPAGMRWVKHFDLEMTRGDSNTTKRIETRILTRTTNDAFGVSYHWNDAGTDAFLVADGGADFDIPIVDGGVTNIQAYRIPSRAECTVCHTPAGGHALSFNTRQLNRDGELAGQAGNQIELLDQSGYLTNYTNSANLLPRHVRPDETEFSLEARVRSYLAVNCAYCHQDGSGSAPASWDGRAELRLADTGVVNGPASNSGSDPANRLVVPGDLAHSIILNRIAVSNGFTRMPSIGSTELDHVNIQLMKDWITEQLPAYQTYDDWRLEQFGSTNSPAGERHANPDLDPADNETEWLTYTDPNDGLSYWHEAYIDAVNGDVSVGYVLSNRHVFIEHNTTLNAGVWTAWDVPGNDGIPLNTGIVNQITVPADANEAFFRFRIEEN
jgi:glucose/arabinose dehydrogenase